VRTRKACKDDKKIEMHDMKLLNITKEKCHESKLKSKTKIRNEFEN
jgi:hypothetical protein